MNRISYLIRNKISTVIIVAAASTACITGCGKSETTYTQAGMEALEALDYDTALEDFTQAQENGENERLILRGQGMTALAQLDYEGAIAYFTEALNKSNGVPEDLDYDLNYYLAAAYYKNGQFDEAVSVYDSILALKPSEADAYYLRGAVTLKQGDFDSAYTDFTSAMELKKGDYDLVVDIYNVLAAEGYTEAGQNILTSVLSSETGLSEYDYGRFEYYLGNYEEAKSYLEQADKGESAQITLYLGRTYEALGDYNYAISLYNTYLDKDSSDAEIYNQMGLCQMKMARYSEALSSFQAGMNVEDSSIMQTLKLNEIVAYEYMEEFQTAATLMSDYIKTYPDDEAAAREYIFLKTR